MKLAPALLLMSALAASGCASSLRVDSATMPPAEFTSTDVDSAALYEASLALGGTVPKPATAQRYARVFAEVEFVSGAFNTHARWLGLQGAAQAEVMIARREVRGVVGISEQAPSQAVVDALLAVSHASDGPALTAALSNPIFTLGPQATLSHLQNVPDLFSTPPALAHLNKAVYEDQNGCSRIFC